MADLSTLETVKHVAGIAPLDTTNDGILLGLLESVENKFKDECGWDIVSTQYTTYFYGSGSDTYTFDRRPVTSVDSLSTVNSFKDETWTAVDTDNYKLRSSDDTYWILKRSRFDRDLEYRLVYTAGYAATAIPEDIQLLLAAFTVIDYEKAGLGRERDRGFDVASVSGGSQVATTTSYSTPMSWWNGVVNRYRRVVI